MWTRNGCFRNTARGFKGFLYHIDKKKEYPAKILKLKEPKRRPRTITKDQINQIVDTCSNFRDKFLITLLWETGMRIGEALAMWLEDFEVDACRVHIRDRGELSNFAEIKTVCSPRTIDISVELINMFLDYAATYHTDDVDTNHVFIKVSGPNANQPMEYPDVTSLFSRLKAKTDITMLHPHILRKDILLAAKNKRIKELEDENKRLKSELQRLRGQLYEKGL